jgi:hypothetical protein
MSKPLESSVNVADSTYPFFDLKPPSEYVGRTESAPYAANESRNPSATTPMASRLWSTISTKLTKP